jgi:hypothetical protein
MSLILFGVALITFLEINFPDPQHSVGRCDASGCYRIYYEQDEQGLLTDDALDKIINETDSAI